MSFQSTYLLRIMFASCTDPMAGLMYSGSEFLFYEVARLAEWRVKYGAERAEGFRGRCIEAQITRSVRNGLRRSSVSAET